MSIEKFETSLPLIFVDFMSGRLTGGRPISFLDSSRPELEETEVTCIIFVDFELLSW